MVSLPSRQPDSIKNAEIDRLLYQVKVIKSDAQGLAGELTRDQFNWQPEPGRWSVAQCLEHLNIMNRLWVTILDKGVSEARARGDFKDGPYAYGFLSRWFLRLVEPPANRRFKAPRKLNPGSNLSVDQVVPEFIALHERVDDLLRLSDGLDLVRVKVPSPMSKLLRYSVGMAFWLVTTHDRRHLWQARQVQQHPSFPKTEKAALTGTKSSS